MAERVSDGPFGDLMKNNAVDVLVEILQEGFQVPADRLSFSIRVSRQKHGFAFFGGFLQL